MSLEEILDAGSDLKLGKEWVIAAVKLPVPQADDTFWSHKVGWATVFRLMIFSVSVSAALYESVPVPVSVFVYACVCTMFLAETCSWAQNQQPVKLLVQHPTLTESTHQHLLVEGDRAQYGGSTLVCLLPQDAHIQRQTHRMGLLRFQLVCSLCSYLSVSGTRTL